MMAVDKRATIERDLEDVINNIKSTVSQLI